MSIWKIHVTGIVQGVGFRPFVYQIATRMGLTGWVANTSAGVEIEVHGAPENVNDFLRALNAEKPPLAQIDSLQVQQIAGDGHATRFEIRASIAHDGAFQPISPDMAICADCLRELFDPHDRRYRYPFINCTNCGPRFTIIQDIPYDRPRTTMRVFSMCEDCAREYHDPTNRRFHAQPVACPRCGPQTWLEWNSRFTSPTTQITNCEPRMADDAISTTRRLLADGYIIAIKGLGGFHLACDATNAATVAELRRRKLRVDKPFALMMPDMAMIEQHCFVEDAARALLEARARPIVLLRRRPESAIAEQVAPRSDFLGVMLPYTPLHYLLLHDSPVPLVMTSGNRSEEPMAHDNAQAREQLASLADAFLMHDRAIHTRCDDSVVRVFEQTVYPVRRARGYAPTPIRLPADALPLLATGAELKNTFCLARERYAFLSHHIGDMENYETLRTFEEAVAHMERLFRIQPRVIAYDLHPNYLATRYALARAEREQLPALGVQHHHAHIAACMAEHGLSGERAVIGVAFDGAGYGDDGAIWGGEVLLADYAGYQRAFHLAYVPLLGGDQAVREPWRIALAWLAQADVAWTPDLAPVAWASAEAQRVVRHQIERRLNAPRTSSVGRLFDAVAALVGVRQVVNYEAQAAIEFENQCARQVDTAYEFVIANSLIDPVPVIRAIVADVRAGVARPIIAARFHQGLAYAVQEVCRRIRTQTGIAQVVLSGGVWQNLTLLARTVRLLRDDMFEVYVHRQVPANDGGLALGQAAVAVAMFQRTVTTRGGSDVSRSTGENYRNLPA